MTCWKFNKIFPRTKFFSKRYKHIQSTELPFRISDHVS